MNINKTIYKAFLFAIATGLLQFVPVQQINAESANDTTARFIFDTAQTSDNTLGTNDDDIGLKAGETVPDFTIKTFEDKPVSKGELLESAPLLVIFYRGGWCPYCNYQIRELTNNWPEFEQRNILPVLISVDEADASIQTREYYNIPFPVLSDPDLAALEAFQVVMEVPEEQYQEWIKKYQLDLETWSDRKHHKIAVSSAFIVDDSGKVLWAHTSKDYATRPSIEQLLGVIDNLKTE